MEFDVVDVIHGRAMQLPFGDIERRENAGGKTIAFELGEECVSDDL